jgi:hypothetical protein
MLAFIAVVFPQMLLLFVICNLLFDMPLEDPLGLFVLTLALALAAIGLGMLLGSLAQTKKQAGSIGMLLGFVLWFASGFTSFPIDLTGGVMQFDLPTKGFKYYLSQITTHAHAINGYFELIINGADLGDFFPISPFFLVLRSSFYR